MTGPVLRTLLLPPLSLCSACPESFTLPYPTLATLFDPLPPFRWATAASVRRAQLLSVRVATAPKFPTPLLSSSASSPHPLLFASSRHRLHLLAVVWSASSINQGLSAPSSKIYQECIKVNDLSREITESKKQLFPMNSIFQHSSSPPRSTATITTLLKACKTIHHLYQVHASIIQRGLEQDHLIISRFIFISASFAATASYYTAVFDCVLSPSPFLWNSLIGAHTKGSYFFDTFSTFIRMKAHGSLPDRYTYSSVIKACSSMSRSWEGKLLHGSALRCGVEGNMFVGTCLVDMYGKCGKIGDARKVFDGMCEKNVVSWTAIVVGYVKDGDMVEAKRLFDEMPQRNVTSWNVMIWGFVKVGDLGNARVVFDAMPKKSVVSFTIMIDGYAKAGDMATSRFLFDQAPEKDIVAWSTLISGYVQNGQPNRALRVFLEMESMNVKPDEFILVSLMSASSQLGNLELARWVDSYVNKSSIDMKQDHVIAALLDMNAKCGNMERALKLFEEMPNRDLVSYCSMIQGLSIHGFEEDALKFFNRMVKDGLTPDEVAFKIILTACSHAGLVDEGWNYFRSMKEKYCVSPSPDHYACMVDLLSRSGHLRDAYELIKIMPVESHAAAWGALLGACKAYGDSELGEIAANQLFEIEPQNAANYVLLSNIYAAADRWIDVSLVRTKMRNSRVRKVPGCSQFNPDLGSLAF